MRPKFVLFIMLLAVTALGLLVALKWIQGARGGAPDAAASLDSAHVEAAALPETEGASATSGTDSQMGPFLSHVANRQVKPSATNSLIVQPTPVLTSIVATTPEEDRRAAIEKEMDKLNEALLDGGSDPKLVEAVRERLLNPDAEVRKAAVETIMHLNDRASIPNLNAALAKAEDPREKVGIMDAIEYLQIPDGNPLFIADTPPPGPPPTGVTKQYPTPRQPGATRP